MLSKIKGARSSIAACLLFLSLHLTGCGYGEVNGETYDCAKALYSVCNLQDATRLTQVSDQIETLLAEKKISQTEAKYLTGIIDKAKGNDWENAAKAARKLMLDQVEN